MKSDLFKINFYFPQPALVEDKQMLVNLIIKAMQKDGNINYAGYLDKNILKKDLLRRIGSYDPKIYRSLTVNERKNIIKIIQMTITKCNKILPLPTKIFIFIFPWFPSKEELVFRGAIGFAVYSCVIHLFLAPDIFLKESIADSIAHEINHIVSFNYHFDRYAKWSLLDHIVNEGLAENFREDVLKTSPAPWAIALSKQEAFKALRKIYSKLNSKNRKIHRLILFGNKKYKHWMGYSIGYWLVKEFKGKNPHLSWGEIVKKIQKIFYDQ